MPGPSGQLGYWSAPRSDSDALISRFSRQRRAAVTVAPAYAVLRLPFVGRGTGRIRGAGALVDLDIRLLDHVWARVFGSFTGHPVAALQVANDDGMAVTIAGAGVIQAMNVGLSAVWAMDLGRFMPLLDAGAGLFWLSTPAPASDGQRGGTCGTGGTCEPGLRCGSQNVCEPVPEWELHVGLGMDVLLGRHWSVGLQVRYHTLATDPANFPVFYTGTLRLGARF
jgi:hypothetical protein